MHKSLWDENDNLAATNAEFERLEVTTQWLCIYSVFVGPQKNQLYGKDISKDISMIMGYSCTKKTKRLEVVPNLEPHVCHIAIQHNFVNSL